MATLYVTEFAGLSRGWLGGTVPSDNLIQIVQTPSITTQVMTVTGSSGSSQAFNTATHIIRVVADVNCWIDFGSSPSATNQKIPIIANSAPEYFGVVPGQKIAVTS